MELIHTQPEKGGSNSRPYGALISSRRRPTSCLLQVPARCFEQLSRHRPVIAGGTQLVVPPFRMKRDPTTAAPGQLQELAQAVDAGLVTKALASCEKPASDLAGVTNPDLPPIPGRPLWSGSSDFTAALSKAMQDTSMAPRHPPARARMLLLVALSRR